MGEKYLDGKEKEEFNPYNLFLILILLILSNNALNLLKTQYKKVHKHKKYKNSAKKYYKVLPEVEKQNIKGTKSRTEGTQKKE